MLATRVEAALVTILHTGPTGAGTVKDTGSIAEFVQNLSDYAQRIWGPLAARGDIDALTFLQSFNEHGRWLIVFDRNEGRFINNVSNRAIYEIADHIIRSNFAVNPHYPFSPNARNGAFHMSLVAEITAVANTPPITTTAATAVTNPVAKICGEHNQRSGCTRPNCRFRHVCSVSGCNAVHSAVDHP